MVGFLVSATPLLPPYGKILPLREHTWLKLFRALDYALQMAAGNFSGANVHVGGVNVYYNVSDSHS